MRCLLLFKITENSWQCLLKFLINSTLYHYNFFIQMNKKLIKFLLHIFNEFCKETFCWNTIKSLILNIEQKQIFSFFIVKISSFGSMFRKDIMNHALWLIINSACSMMIHKLNIKENIFNISFYGWFSIFLCFYSP
jgi:hypothetical protein